MGMLGCAILIPGPPGLLGVFQAGIYAGMTMYYPTSVVVGAGAAYVFLMYASQVVFQLAAGGWGLLTERGGLKALEEAEGLSAGDPPTLQIRGRRADRGAVALRPRADGKLAQGPAVSITAGHDLGRSQCGPRGGTVGLRW